MYSSDSSLNFWDTYSDSVASSTDSDLLLCMISLLWPFVEHNATSIYCQIRLLWRVISGLPLKPRDSDLDVE